MQIPEGFEIMMKDLLGPEAQPFFKALQEPPAVAVRLNSRKPSGAFADCPSVPWCDCGRYLDARPVFTLDPLLHAGAYYVQDASSMILRHITALAAATLAAECGLQPAQNPLNVIDLCAAPGGKTTAIIDALTDGSRVVANEYVAKRAAILRENLAKWGYPGAVVTNCDSARFAQAGDIFDIVNVDAPCSGEGMMRKDEDAVAQWSPQLISQCASLQREILTNAAKIVAPGGFLIYSTCTYNRIENEENAEFIANNIGLIPFNPRFPEEWGIRGGIGSTLPVARFMPHLTRGEGLFVAIFRKPGNFSPSKINSATPSASRRTPDRKATSKKQAAQSKIAGPPAIEDILSRNFDPSQFPEVDVDRLTAISYLRRESVVLPPYAPRGIVILTFQGLPLGAAKNIGSRANNLYPKNWRILMR